MSVATPLISIYRRDQVSGLPVHEVQHTVSVPALPGAMAISIPDALLFVLQVRAR
jgi:hypothetical protein